ncbi:MAG: hypothetical protein Q8O84_00500 [Nanoarchaeota archaeon]|nr:hypothetical protein [Nanoarchaeota archaeon]
MKKRIENSQSLSKNVKRKSLVIFVSLILLFSFIILLSLPIVSAVKGCVPDVGLEPDCGYCGGESSCTAGGCGWDCKDAGELDQWGFPIEICTCSGVFLDSSDDAVLGVATEERTPAVVTRNYFLTTRWTVVAAADPNIATCYIPSVRSGRTVTNTEKPRLSLFSLFRK